MLQRELEARAIERAKMERTRVIKLAGQERYLARSRSMEPGAYYELSVTTLGTVRCNCPAYTYRSVCKHAAALQAKLAREARRAGPASTRPSPLKGAAS